LAGWDFQIDLNLKNIKNTAGITGSVRESGAGGGGQTFSKGSAYELRMRASEK
jgi:hypothetical protein